VIRSSTWWIVSTNSSRSQLRAGSRGLSGEASPLAQMRDQVRLRVDREDGARLADGGGEPPAEVARAGADVGDGRAGADAERGDHLVGLLPGVARRIVEDLLPLLDVGEVVARRRVVRAGERGGRQAGQGCEDERCAHRLALARSDVGATVRGARP
jgi:hypothetical protein